MATNSQFPSKASLVSQYVGRSLHDIPLPAAVIDISAVKRNCQGMLRLKGEGNAGVDFLSLVETHKTVEITRLQFGDHPEEVRFLVTDLSAVENLLPLLLEYQRKGVQVTILYGVPISQSKVPQLANLIKILGRQGGCVRVLVDHPSQCLLLQQIFQLSGYPTYILINVDITGQNSGLQPHSRDFRVLFSQIEQHALRDGPFMFTYVGLFSKIGSGPPSIDVSTAVQSLGQELRTLFESSPVQGVRLSIFADQSPLCVPAMASSQSGDPVPYDLSSIERTLGTISETEDSLEVHTTDYCLSDIQCVNTLTNLEVADTLFDQIGSMPLTILTEVISIYHDRDENLARPLIGIGSEILGRSKSDICANWGIAKQWNVEPRIIASDLHHLGWTVDHVERGSSILKWAGSEELMQPLHFGQRLRIHPNDAASASDAFGWYFVVDSSRVGREDEIIDVFVRWRA